MFHIFGKMNFLTLLCLGFKFEPFCSRQSNNLVHSQQHVSLVAQAFVISRKIYLAWFRLVFVISIRMCENRDTFEMSVTHLK